LPQQDWLVQGANTQAINNLSPAQNTQPSGVNLGFLLRMSSLVGVAIQAVLNAITIDNLSKIDNNQFQ